MAKVSRLSIAKSDIEDALSGLSNRVLTKAELAALLAERRAVWRLTERTSTDQLIEFLSQKSQLQAVVLRSLKYEKVLTRYVWRSASKFEIALSLGPTTAYLSHATAIFLHGLTDLIPRQIFVNVEQSPKPLATQPPSQVSIDRAFRSRQRSSNLVYEFEDGSAVSMLSGKATKGLEVQRLVDPMGAQVRVTSVERTLIDAVVRPSYAGGIDNIVAAYKAARDRVSTNRLRATLIQLGYVYPYHQAIGFLMERAGYSAPRVALMRELGLSFDFYLAHGIEKPRFIPEWRLHVPEHLA